MLTVLNNPIVFTLTVMFVGVYSAYIAPRPGPWLKTVIQNTYFKIFFFFIVILLAHQDPRIALILSVAFVLTVQSTSGRDFNPFHLSRKSSYTVPAPPQPLIDTIPPPSSLVDAVVREPQYDEITAEDGETYQIHQDTETVFPLHPDLIHSSAQALGEPLTGFDPGFDGAEY